MASPSLLSLVEARSIALRAQGLEEDAPWGSGEAGARKTLQHLGYVQIDTISVVERAHHHVLWSRNPAYRPDDLASLIGKKQAFEYWDHAASFLPIEAYRFCLPRMQALESGKSSHWFKRDRAMMARVLARIRAEGPLQARDFEPPEGGRAGGPWFEWKPAKRALEQLFMEGQLMIASRRGFQKVFDLTERVLPPGLDTRVPAPGELAAYLVERALRTHGIFREPEARYLRRGLDQPVAQAVRHAIESGQAREVRIQGQRNAVYVASTAALETLSKSGARGHKARLLSPFDSFVIQRKRLRDLFSFDYLIECYVPAPKRKFGYFCLPVLWRGELVCRIDAKADRNARRLLVQSAHLEPGFRPDARFTEGISSSLAEFAAFNDCDAVSLAPGAARVLKTSHRAQAVAP
jgi:uncharacterized protein YcaQ